MPPLPRNHKLDDTDLDLDLDIDPNPKSNVTASTPPFSAPASPAQTIGKEAALSKHEDDGENISPDAYHIIATTDRLRDFAPAAEKVRLSVFYTTELLENILNHLQFEDVSSCTRVCQRFRETIAKSSMLQRKLTFEETITSASKFMPDEGCFERVLVQRQLCPLLSLEPHNPNPFILFDLASYNSDTTRWAPMYLTNPPVLEARIRLRFHVESSTHVETLTASAAVRATDQGLTLGKLVNAVMEKPYSGSVAVFVKLTGRDKWLDNPAGTYASALKIMEEFMGVRAVPIHKDCWIRVPY